jgi:hypothetical protein
MRATANGSLPERVPAARIACALQALSTRQPSLSCPAAIGKAHRFFDFMVPYNWCQVPQSALLVLVGIESETGILGPQASETIDVVAAVATLVYEWYIARIALETTGSTAAFVVLVDLVLGVALSRVSGSLY